jgi:TolB-like protein
MIPRSLTRSLAASVLAVIFTATSAAQEQNAGTAEEAATAIADQFISSIRPQPGGKQPRIAVQDLTGIDGRVTNLGRFLAEEVLTNLFSSGGFSIIERRHLRKIMEEKGLLQKGITQADPRLLEEIGRILGADAIVAGTIADGAGNRVVTARVISTKDGEILAVARATLAEEPGVKALESVVEEASAPPALSAPPLAKCGIVLLEDFMKVEHGHLPAGWIGPNSVLVKKSTVVQGNVLTSETTGEKSLHIPIDSFPADFRLEMKIKSSIGDWLKIEIGDLLFSWKEGDNWDLGQVWFAGTRGAFPQVHDQLALLTIERRNSVVKVFVNGKESIINRVPSFAPPIGFTMKWKVDRIDRLMSFYHIKLECLS